MYNLFFNGHNAVLTIGISMCCATDIFGIKIAYLLTYLLTYSIRRYPGIAIIVDTGFATIRPYLDWLTYKTPFQSHLLHENIQTCAVTKLATVSAPVQRKIVT